MPPGSSASPPSSIAITMGLKRVRPSTAPPSSTGYSSSSGSGSGATSGSSSTTGDVETWSMSASDYSFGSSGSWSSSSSSSSSSGNGDATIDPIDLLPKELRPIVDVPRPDSDIPWTSTSETCYYTRLNEDGCFYPRSCRECLDMKGCMINQLGQCVSQAYDHYNGSMNFQLAIFKNMSGPHATNRNASRTQMYHFPSSIMPYCPADEATCKLCKRTDFKKKIDSRFCVGRYQKQSCLCISICESPVREEVLVHRNCTDPLDSNTAAKEIAHPLMSTPSMFTLVVAPIVLLFVTYRVWKRHSRSRTGSDDTVEAGRGDDDDEYDAADSVWSWSTSTTAMDVQPEGIHPRGRLELFGWQAQRQEMIEKEQMLLSGMEDPSIGDRYVEFDALPREVGDDTRPVSPDRSLSHVAARDEERFAESVSVGHEQRRRRLFWDESELSML